MKRRMESIDHQPKLITIRPKIQQTSYDGYIVSQVTDIFKSFLWTFPDVNIETLNFQASAMRAVSMGDSSPLELIQKQPDELRQPCVNGAVNGIAGSNHTGNIDQVKLSTFHQWGISWQLKPSPSQRAQRKFLLTLVHGSIPIIFLFFHFCLLISWQQKSSSFQRAQRKFLLTFPPWTFIRV